MYHQFLIKTSTIGVKLSIICSGIQIRKIKKEVKNLCNVFLITLSNCMKGENELWFGKRLPDLEKIRNKRW